MEDDPSRTPPIPASTHDLTRGELDQRESTLGSPVRFELGEELGRGGMGRVVEARDRRLDRGVAIKEAAAPTPALLARFEREIRITARLQHPSIVPLYDAGYTPAGAPYYVMRRVTGRTLHDHVAEHRELRRRLALLPSFLAAADAIAYAHAQDIIHRDLKPANILLGDHGETVVIDWGLAKQLGDPEPSDPGTAAPPGLTGHGAVLGTLGYMAPEQRRGDPTGAPCDVYALGATLHHVLLGAPPGDQLAALPASVPRELATIVDKATAADPAARYADASGLASDVRRYLTGQLVAAHRYSVGERIARFARRHAIAVGAAAIAAVVAIAAIAIAVVNVVAARDRAEDGWAHAIERGDELLLARADSLVEVDPTRAALLAASLPGESPRWDRARSIVARARAIGIPRMYGGHTDVVPVLELDPAERRLLAVDRTGTVLIHDLATGAAQRPPGLPPGVHGATWADGGRAVAVALDEKIEVVGFAGDRRELATTGPAVFASVPGAPFLAWRDSSGAYVAPPGSAAVVALARGPGELQASRDGHWLATSSSHAPLELWRPDGTRVEVPRPLESITMVAFAADGTRLAAIVAAAERTRVVELALGAAVTERGSWDTPFAARVVYGGRALFAAFADGRVLALGERAVVRTLTGALAMVAAPLRDGVALSTGDDRIVVIDATRERTLRVPDGHRIRGLVATTAGMLLAGTMTGPIVAWNLRDAGPLRLPDDPASSYSDFFDPETLVRCDDDRCEVVRWRTGTVVGTGKVTQAVTGGLVGPGGELALIGSFDGTIRAVRARDGAVERVGTSGLEMVAFVGPSALAATVGRAVTLYRPFAGRPAEPLAQLPGDPVALAATGAAVAAALDDGHLWRRDLRSGATASIALPHPARALAFVPGGDVIAATGAQLVRWSGDRVVDLATLPSEVVALAADPTSGALTAITKQRTVHLVTPDGTVRSAIAPAGPLALRLTGRPGTAYTVGGDRRAVLIDAAAGALRTLPSLPATTAAVASDGTAAVLTPDGIEIYPDDLPRTPAALRAWLAGATNATLDADLATVRWP